MSVNENLRSSSSLQVQRQSQSRSSRRSRHSRSSVSVVAPQKDNDRNAIMKVPRECDCGSDLYSRVLGPTADETILHGLQTVIDLCNKLRVCGDKDESDEEEPGKEDDAEYDLPERDNTEQIQTDDKMLKGSRSQTDPRDVKGSRSQTDSYNVKGSISQTDPRDIKTSRSQTDSQNLKSSISQTSRSMVSAGFQVNPSVTNAEAQTESYPEMVSEILQTIGLDPELVSKIIQTSFMSLPEQPPLAQQERRASLASMFMQTSNPSIYSAALQTTYPDLISGFAQTSSRFLPTIDEAASPEPLAKSVSGTQSDQVSTASKQTMVVSNNGSCRSIRSMLQKRDDSSPVEKAIIGDEHKCISPPEPPLIGKTCRCCKCSSSAQLHRKSSTKSISGGKKKCVCHKTSKCRCTGSRSSISSASGEAAQEVKYAVTRISKYKDFTTFEVMKSTRNKPKQIPKSVEGVFVLKKQKDKDPENNNGKLLYPKNGRESNSNNSASGVIDLEGEVITKDSRN